VTAVVAAVVVVVVARWQRRRRRRQKQHIGKRTCVHTPNIHAHLHTHKTELRQRPRRHGLRRRRTGLGRELFGLFFFVCRLTKTTNRTETTGKTRTSTWSQQQTGWTHENARGVCVCRRRTINRKKKKKKKKGRPFVSVF